MKRILVVDESKAVRETLVVVLGREFVVVQRSSLEEESPYDSGAKFDLLILGISPGSESGLSFRFKVPPQFSCPILFLVESRSLARLLAGQGRTDCLVKPFHPYELRDKVRTLLARSELPSGLLARPSGDTVGPSRYLDFPYLPADTSHLAKRFAMTSFPILIVGEVGSGHDRIARGLHSLNKRAGAWIPAYPREITEGQLDQKVAGSRVGGVVERATLFLDGLETLDPGGQASLLRFLDKVEAAGGELWILSSSRVDLLERVYQGEFLDHLYYRLATLTLRLAPLRERRVDLPSLAARVAQEYGDRLGLGRVRFSAGALDRLSQYLWFGNISELEAVIATTLATHRKDFIEAPDLVLESEGGAKGFSPPAVGDEPSGPQKKGERTPVDRPEEKGKLLDVRQPENGNFPDFNVLINQLAHEMKNPMVTIKTFAQLLQERYDDSLFRTHFKEAVGADIDRMDDLLETLLDFSRFSGPAVDRVVLQDQLRRVLEEVSPECISKGASVRWVRGGGKEKVFVDEAQLRYAFKNIFQAVLAQVRSGGEILIDVEEGGGVVLSYIREGGGIIPLTHYLGTASQGVGGEALPLRILLAKRLLERNGGSVELNVLGGERVQIRMTLPAA